MIKTFATAVITGSLALTACGTSSLEVVLDDSGNPDWDATAEPVTDAQVEEMKQNVNDFAESYVTKFEALDIEGFGDVSGSLIDDVNIDDDSKEDIVESACTKIPTDELEEVKEDFDSIEDLVPDGKGPELVALMGEFIDEAIAVNTKNAEVVGCTPVSVDQDSE